MPETPAIVDDLQPGAEVYILAGGKKPERRTVKRVYKHGQTLTVTRVESTVASPMRHSAWEVAERIASWQVVTKDGVRLYREDGSRTERNPLGSS